ncbi:WhiB family transcriptional regulator [Pseudonocardia phyllosphaerae]|uniref:WhiB family transcriptional regulator n=1 Tax=Pseudonocardia phyllosphaerae TaxID=3390502 RepID=UPI00397A3A01
MVGRDESWRSEAACRSVDPELFFPESANGREALRQVAQAKRVCRRCPVEDACAQWALAELRHGIAGGMTEDERRRRRRGGERGNGGGGPVRRGGVPRRSFRSDRAHIIISGCEAIADGVPLDEVAAAHGVSLRTAERWARDVRNCSAPGGRR